MPSACRRQHERVALSGCSDSAAEDQVHGRIRRSCAILIETIRIAVRQPIIAVGVALLNLLPAQAGDLGIYDERLAGIGNALQGQRYDQRDFTDREGSRITFTKERMLIVLSDKYTQWVQERDQGRLGNIRLDSASRESFIKPSQVLGYDYQTTSGAGILFKIFYKTRGGDSSLASLQITDENTGKSFHNTFLMWVNGKLDAAQ
jgi:hypothetical protein